MIFQLAVVIGIKNRDLKYASLSELNPIFFCSARKKTKAKVVQTTYKGQILAALFSKNSIGAGFLSAIIAMTVPDKTKNISTPKLPMPIDGAKWKITTNRAANALTT